MEAVAVADPSADLMDSARPLRSSNWIRFVLPKARSAMEAVAGADPSADLMDSARCQDYIRLKTSLAECCKSLDSPRWGFRGLDFHDTRVIQFKSSLYLNSLRYYHDWDFAWLDSQSQLRRIKALLDECRTLADSLSDGATVGVGPRFMRLVPDEKLKLPSSFKRDLQKFIALFMGPSLIKDPVLTKYCLKEVFKLSCDIRGFLFRLNLSRRQRITHKISGFRTRMKDAIHRYHTGRCITSTPRPGEEIDMDYFGRIVKRGDVPLSVVLNPWGIELHTIRYSERLFTLVEWRSSVHHPLVRSLLFAKNAVSEGTGGDKPNGLGRHCSTSLVPPTEELVNNKAEEHAHYTSCVIVGKGNYARPHNGLAAASSEGVASVCNPSLGSNGSAETPICPLEGLVSRPEEEISMDDLGRIVKRGGAPLPVVTNSRGIKFHLIRYSGIKYSERVKMRILTLVEWRSSVHHPLVRSLLFIKNPVSEETGGDKPNGLGRHYSTSLVPPTEELVNNKAEEHAHSTSCVIVGKGNYARPGNGLATASPEGVAACHVCCSSNALIDPPITPQEGRLICSGSDPASADNCSITSSKTPEPTWYVASAAAHHMTGNLDLLNGYTPMSADLVVHAANMGPMQVHGSGSVNTANVDLRDVWYVPGLDTNLISTSQLAKVGYTITLGPYGCRISKDDEDETLVGKAHFTDDYLFELDFLKVPSAN